MAKIYRDTKRKPSEQWVLLRKHGSTITLEGFPSRKKAREAARNVLAAAKQRRQRR